MFSAQKVYSMLGNESLWEVANQCNEILSNASISYSICGGVAVCLHGYQRNTTDLDLIVRREDSSRIRSLLLEAGFQCDEGNSEFRTQNGVAIQFLLAGDKAGRESEVLIAEPLGDLNVEEREGLFVVRLSRLIEMKIACGMSSLRRTHKDFADVVELIAIRKLDAAFARFLHPTLRDTFRKLVHNATDPENS